MQITKEEAGKLLQGDFIPDGGSVEVETLHFRRTTPDEVFQCCRQTNYDPQSGPIYCGNIAEYVAEVGEDMYTGLCERHPPSKHLIDD